MQTSSPTSSITARPCSSNASTAAPSRRHCIRPGVCGNSRLAPMNAPAKSVPPDMLAHHMSACAALPLTAARPAKRSLNHCWVSAGERRSRRAQRAQFRQVADGGEIDPGLGDAGKERRAGAEERHLRLGNETPQRGPVRLVLRSARTAVEDAAGGAVEQAVDLAVPHDPAGRAVPMVALAERIRLVAAADIVVQHVQRQRHDR